jgi:hypothetical protein
LPALSPTTGATSIALDPARSPAPPPDCDGAYSLLEWVEPPSIDSVAPRASSIVVGTIIGVGAGQWNTETGQPPRDAEDIDPYLDVMTVVRVRVDEVLAGTTGPITTVWFPGGKIGCATYSVSDYPGDVDMGQRFVVATRELTPRTGLEGVEQIEAMWRIDDHGRVSTLYDGTMPLSELAARVRAARTP